MRALLDRLYAAALWASASCILVIAGLVFLQVAGRALDGAAKLFGAAPPGFVILSLSEIAGYLLAAASFLALAATLRAGVHIRVTMLLGAVPAAVRSRLEAVAFAVATGFCLYMTLWVGRLALDSLRFNEISPGLIPVPLVLPQAAMALGLAVLSIALADELVTVLRSGRPSFRAVEEAVSLGKEG